MDKTSVQNYMILGGIAMLTLFAILYGTASERDRSTKSYYVLGLVGLAFFVLAFGVQYIIK